MTSDASVACIFLAFDQHGPETGAVEGGLEAARRIEVPIEQASVK
jgi:hypothetical protein